MESKELQRQEENETIIINSISITVSINTLIIGKIVLQLYINIMNNSNSSNK